MEDLIFKESLTKQEAEQLDCYLEKNIEKAIKLENQDIVRIIESTKKILGYSLFENELKSFLAYESLLDLLFDSRKINYYIKCHELCCRLSLECYGFAYALGNYFYYNDQEKALKIYQSIFKEGFNLCSRSYFDHLRKFLNLSNISSVEILIKLINTSPRDENYSVEFIDTYILLVNNLDKDDERYIKYINEGIIVAAKVVEKCRKRRGDGICWFDTEEERDLCELLTLKMKYYLNKREYIKTFEAYKELGDEMRKTDCTKYYYAREKFYHQMLALMSVDYPELSFFKDIRDKRFEVLEDIKDIHDCLNQEITLKDEENQTFRFVITNFNRNGRVVIAPILPLLGKGGYIFMKVIKVEDKYYFENKF